ncbi:MAG: family 16 glycoside hydrolase [Verrucomicrobiota bacterium]
MILRIACFAWLVSSLAMSAAPDWEPLFNNRDLRGWKIGCLEKDRHKAYWQVRDDTIECNTAGDRKHDYVWLMSEREYGDFEFECLVQSFATSTGNSGIQIRSRFINDATDGGWMHGPQIDLHPLTPWRCGMIYDETRGTQRWICPPLPDSHIGPEQAPESWEWVHADGKTILSVPAMKPPVSSGNWNRVRIVARGPRIETEINGLPISRFDGTGILDDEAHRRSQVGMRGHIALQLHAGDDLKIRFKDLRIRELSELTEQPAITVVRDDSQLRGALASLRPGSVVRIAPGNYRPGVSLKNVNGTSGQPILIEGLDPRLPPHFEGGNEAWHLSDVSHLELRWLHFHGQSGNGINVDDGGSFDTPSHHVTLSHLQVEDTGPNGNFDAIKCSGLDNLLIRQCRIAGWGGQAIDFVGCHHAEIRYCRITGKPGFSQHTGPQFKGGSSDVWIHHCRLENAGARPIQAGGSTGLEFFRPQGAPYEATRIRIEDNVIIGGECAVAFTGATDCECRFNTIERPEKWVFRILQEQRDARFFRCGNNRISNNIFVFERSKVRTIVNIGPDTEPKTFGFRGNHWFASDAPDRFRPDLPVRETEGVYGVDPDLDPATGLPRHKLPAGPR